VEGIDGSLYGTTLLGGGTNSCGTVFKINKNGQGYTVLHRFAGGDEDGGNSMSGLLVGSDGSMYGVTDGGGNTMARNGIVYRLSSDGSGFKVLHNFPDKRYHGDGRMPRSPLIEGRDGALYGTTQSGGTNDFGTVFKLNKDGSGYQVLHQFSGYGNNGDGAGPTGLVQNKDGVIFGATEFHGINGGGTIFKMNSNGSGFTILHSFPNTSGDGKNPSGNMLVTVGGAIIGMTKISETNNFATIFKLF
jgi:uncharacterized repeat protein (TIGR03803 family)